MNNFYEIMLSLKLNVDGTNDKEIREKAESLIYDSIINNEEISKLFDEIKLVKKEITTLKN